MARRHRTQGAGELEEPLREYFAGVFQIHGRGHFYWDTSAILNCFSPAESRFVAFLNQVAGQPLATSTFVVTETVRRLVKAKRLDEFIGPRRERGGDLARLVLEAWLKEHDIIVLHPHDVVFERAKSAFLTDHRALGCDLCDSMSYVMVTGLEQHRIVAADLHFRSMGLTCLP